MYRIGEMANGIMKLNIWCDAISENIHICMYVHIHSSMAAGAQRNVWTGVLHFYLAQFYTVCVFYFFSYRKSTPSPQHTHTRAHTHTNKLVRY